MPGIGSQACPKPPSRYERAKEKAQTLCECGCGQPAPLAHQTDTKRGYVQGQPRRFVLGHQFKCIPKPTRRGAPPRIPARCCPVCGVEFHGRASKRCCSAACGRIANGRNTSERYQRSRDQVAPACRVCGAAIRDGKPSHLKRRKFCSRACATSALGHKKAQHPKRAQTCVVCGGPIVRDNARLIARKQKTCSAKCGYEFRKQQTRPAKTCSVCGIRYFPGGRFGVKYCSVKCFRTIQAKRFALVDTPCHHCGKVFRRTRAAIKRQKRSFCGNACRIAFFVGENSPMFRGDKDPNRGAAWNKLAATIRARDCYACRRCGIGECALLEKLSVDHVRPWRSFKDKTEANHPDNLVALCRTCHSFKTTVVERAWLRGDVLAWKQWVASLHLPSAAKFGFMA